MSLSPQLARWVGVHTAGLAVLLFTGAGALAQVGVGARDPGMPGATRERIPGPGPTPTVHVYPDGSVFEIEPEELPRFIVPDAGVGLPPGDLGVKHQRATPRCLPNLPPVYGPDTRWEGPATEDMAANFDSRAQPLFQDFAGMGPNGWTPPDPTLAAGLDYVVGVTNDDITVWDRCGAVVFTVDINTYLGVGTDYELFDPKIFFDPWDLRWVMQWHKKKVSTEESYTVIAITAGVTPFGLSGAGAYWYNFNAVQNGGTGEANWADYYDLGYSNDWVTQSGNQFRFSDDAFKWSRIRWFDKAEVYAAVGASTFAYFNLTNPDGTAMTTPRSVQMQTSLSSAGLNVDAMYINSRDSGGDKLTLRKITDAGGANTLTSADITTTAYVNPPNAVQPGGATLDTINCRLMPAVFTNDTLGANGQELFTGLTTAFGSETACHLFKIAPATNTLEFETRLFSPGLYYWFPSVAADYSGSAFWVFSRTGNSAGNEAEARYVDYDQGVWSNSSSALHDGTGVYGGFRWGDYLGAQLDWGDYYANLATAGRPAKVWMVGEYATAGNWSTHVGATSVFTQGSLSSVTPTTTYVATGPVGGPFAPASRVYTLGHTGQTGLQFQVTSLPTWLSSSLTGTNADLYPGGGTVTLSVNASANALAKGTYNDSVVVSDCFNGGLSYIRAVQLVVQAPDLRVVSIDAANGTYHPGDLINVTGSYHNDGDFATGAYTARFYASTDATITTADTFLELRNYASLAPGGTQAFNHNLTAPCITDAKYFIGVIVTVTNDSNTTNNVGHDATAVILSHCPADFNNDCFVDGSDADAFNNAFEAGDLSADYNHDGFVDGSDSDQFNNDFEAGC